MDRKLVINLCVLIALICVGGLVMIGMGPLKQAVPTEEEMELARVEDRIVVNE